MQRIVPHLWFDTQAKEAADFYVHVFSGSGITSTSKLHNTPSGDTDVISLKIWGHELIAINAGPLFNFNPSISFMVNFDPSRDKNAAQKLDHIWGALADGGTVLMPLDEYPFSKKYGWVQDIYGLSWQLILTDPGGEERPVIIPSMLFVNDVCGKAEEATDHYISVFKRSKRGSIARYPAGMEPDKEGTLMFTDFMLEGQWFVAMDSAQEHNFSFNEAISFLVSCDTQEEIDYYWDELSAVPEAENCGWLKDKYGISWQITPKDMQQMINTGTPGQIQRVTQAFLKMKKPDLQKLWEAYESEPSHY